MESLAVILITKPEVDYELFATARNFDRYIVLNDISLQQLNELKKLYELSVLVEKENVRDFGDTIVIRSSGQSHERVELDPKRSI